MPQPRPLLAVLGAALVGVAVFGGLTEGIDRVAGTHAPVESGDPGYLPELVYDPPETVPTTEARGPVGPVSLVFADDQVRTGLTGELTHPWVAVSSRTGDYRALSAPHLPAPGADMVAVSDDGSTLAWAFGGGVVLYDAVTDRAREVTLGTGSRPTVGAFSPDGRHLVVHDGRLSVLEVATGNVVATLTGIDERQTDQVVWTPDGSALTYVAEGQLVRHQWADDTTRRAAAPIASAATLSWAPTGDQLAASRRTPRGNVVDVFALAPHGSLARTATVKRELHSMQRFLGFSGDTTVTAIGLALESGPVPKAYRMPASGGPQATEVMRLPGQRHVTASLEVAADPLARGSTHFPEPDWPVSDRAKLMAAALTAFFLLGLYLTRRPRGASRRR